MEKYLKICKDGFKLLTSSEELNKKYNFYSKNKKFHIVDLETKEVVSIVDTEREAMEFKSNLIPLGDESLFSSMRHALYFEKDLTVGDLFQVFEGNEQLSLFLSDNFPYWNCMKEETDADEFLIKRKFSLEPDGLVLNNDSNLTFSKNYSDLPILLCNDAKVCENDEVLLEGEFSFSLLELIQCLFSSVSEPSDVYFENGDLVDETGMPIDPMKCLFNRLFLVDCKFKDFFDYVKNNEEFQDFLSEYSWCNIELFQDEINRPPEEEETSIKELKLSFTIQEHSYTKYPKTIDCSFDFGGTGEDENGRKESYGIDLTPVNNLAHIPVVIDRKVTGYKWPLFDVKAKKSEGVIEEIDLGELNPCVLDVFSEIFWEISFFGTPERRDSTLDDLRQTVNEIKSEEEKLKPLEDVFEELEEKRIQRNKEYFGEDYVEEDS